MENTTFKVPAENLGWLKEKLEKLNRRADKLGMSPIELIVLGEKVERYTGPDEIMLIPG